MNLDIGGLCTALSTAEPDVETIVRRRYGGFLSDAAPTWRVAVERRPQVGIDSEDVIVSADAAPGCFRVQRSDGTGCIDITRRDARLVLGTATDATLDVLLRVTHTIALLDRGALLVHAAGLVHDGRAYVFPGLSGAGKTTITRLSPDEVLLSDESSIVDRQGRAWGTPFSGDLARPGENVAAPLAGLYFIEQSDHHERVALGRREALTSLLTNVMCFVREPEPIRRLLAIAHDVVARVPAFRLLFRRDAGFWEVIRHG